jgi:phosphohistidine phosphatase
VDLYLVRHAIAAQRSAARWPDDSRRPLTPEGAARFRSAARGLATVVPTVDRLLSSAYARAWETAEILHDETRWPKPEPSAPLEADRSPEDAFDLLQKLDATGSLALVGHEPLLSMLASRLLTGENDLVRLELKKGSILVLELTAVPGRQAAVLRWSLSPKVLRKLDPERQLSRR